MKLKPTAIRLLMIGAVPAVLMIGAAVPAAAHEGAYSMSSACQSQDREAHWKQFGHHWASYAEFRDYYEKNCSDDGDRATRDVEKNDDRDHELKADHDKPKNDKHDDRSEDKDGGGGGSDFDDAKGTAERHDTDPDIKGQAEADHQA